MAEKWSQWLSSGRVAVDCITLDSTDSENLAKIEASVALKWHSIGNGLVEWLSIGRKVISVVF